MKRLILGCCLFVTYCLISVQAQANTFVFQVDGLPEPSGIESFNVALQVGSNFDYVTDSLQLGDAIPSAPEGVLPWGFSDANPTIDDEGKFVIDAYNGDIWDEVYVILDGEYSENNILNGTWFTFEYSGNIKKISDFSFSNSSGNPPADITLSLVQFDENGAKYSTSAPVPLPSAAFLLLSGIIGASALKKRRN